MKIKYFVFCLVLFGLSGLPASSSAKSTKQSNWQSFQLQYQSSETSKMLVGWNGKRLVVKLKPLVGEGGYSLARRVLLSNLRSLKTIRKYSKTRRLYRNRFITFPLKVINGSIRSSALKAVFFKDKAGIGYWKHRVTFAWETTSMIAGLFTKEGIKAGHLVRYNKMRNKGNILKKGDVIKIPWKWISPELSLRQVSLKPPLKLKQDKSGKLFAHYQMKHGETLYSSVVIRFTGRLLNDEVNQVANKLLKLNNISDAKLIQTRQKIRIPLEWLSEEYLSSQTNDVSSRKTSVKKTNKKKTKKIDALINNVGVAGPTGTIEKLNSEDWERTLKINVISHFYFTKLAIPMLKKNKGGSIINLSSVAGIMGFPLRSPYAASKWAIIGMTKTLAMELGKFKIRVNAICPGTIKGDRMVRVIRDKAKFLKVSKKLIEKDFISMASMNCWIHEEDIGKMCSFLISSDSERISGQTIPVDGNATRID